MFFDSLFSVAHLRKMSYEDKRKLSLFFFGARED